MGDPGGQVVHWSPRGYREIVSVVLLGFALAFFLFLRLILGRLKGRPG